MNPEHVETFQEIDRALFEVRRRLDTMEAKLSGFKAALPPELNEIEKLAYEEFGPCDHAPSRCYSEDDRLCGYCRCIMAMRQLEASKDRQLEKKQDEKLDAYRNDPRNFKDSHDP